LLKEAVMENTDEKRYVIARIYMVMIVAVAGALCMALALALALVMNN